MNFCYCTLDWIHVHGIFFIIIIIFKAYRWIFHTFIKSLLIVALNNFCDWEESVEICIIKKAKEDVYFKKEGLY